MDELEAMDECLIIPSIVIVPSSLTYVAGSGLLVLMVSSDNGIGW